MKLTQERFQTSFILILSIVLLLIHAFPAFFLLNNGILSQNSVWFACIVALGAFLMLFCVPALFIKFVLKKPLSDFGFRLPESTSEALKLTCLTTLLFLPAVIFLGTLLNFQQYYTIKENLDTFFIFSILSSGLYYFSEEFLFRGFLFFGLWDKFKFHSFWIINLVFALFHISKPSGEASFAFFLGLALCYLSLKTKSFIPAAILHFLLAIVLNLTVFLTSF